jgi:hypothetical protein
LRTTLQPGTTTRRPQYVTPDAPQHRGNPAAVPHVMFGPPIAISWMGTPAAIHRDKSCITLHLSLVT